MKQLLHAAVLVGWFFMFVGEGGTMAPSVFTSSQLFATEENCTEGATWAQQASKGKASTSKCYPTDALPEGPETDLSHR